MVDIALTYSASERVLSRIRRIWFCLNTLLSDEFLTVSRIEAFGQKHKTMNFVEIKRCLDANGLSPLRYH